MAAWAETAVAAAHHYELMAGYTPLFDSLTTGTLYGKWPDIGLWAVILSLPDKRGIVDVTPEYLAGVTGLPVEEVIACMDRFCKPDPRSRSGVEGGARLVLIDPSRNWGWRIVNHAMYRERARKMAYDSDRTASGADAARKRQSREVPTPPAKSREVPLSDADADADTKKNSEVLSRSSSHLHVSSSSPTLKPQERLKKSSGDGNGREKLRELTRSLAQSKALPKQGRTRSPQVPSAERTEPQRPEGAEDRQR